MSSSARREGSFSALGLTSTVPVVPFSTRRNWRKLYPVALWFAGCAELAFSFSDDGGSVSKEISAIQRQVLQLEQTMKGLFG